MSARGTSISFRLLMAFLGVVVTSSGLITAVFYGFSVKFQQEHVEERLLQQLEAIDRSFHYHFQEALVRDLRVLSSNPLLDEFIMSSELEKQIISKAVERLFLQTLTHTTSYQSVSFINVLGREVVRVDRTGRVRKYRDFKAAGLFTRLKTGAPGSISIEGPSRGPDGEVLFTVGIHKVDGDIGKFGGMLLIQYRFEEFFDYLEGIRIFGENPIWVLAPSGEVLKRPSSKEASFSPMAYLPRNLFPVAKLLPSKVGMLAYQDLLLTPDQPLIRMALSIPSDLLLKDIRETVRFILLVFLASMIGALALAASISRFLSRPIVELAFAAERLAKGDLSSQVNIHASGEVKMLVESFNRMTEDLRRLMSKERELADAATASAEAERSRARELERLKEQLIEKAQELERSNYDLQQFAYVASHDLQEPLRMVASYMQLLERRYQSKLDTEAKEFIAYAVGGVTRMRTLINDLLEYSRVGTRGKAFERMDSSAIVDQALANLQVSIGEAGAVVTHEDLPSIMGDSLQLSQVFQNLIGNAIKYRRKELSPAIHISAAHEDHAWVFSVRDNGIGIEPQYADRVFVIFQRLHTTVEYPGTGIGLAICKKIIERHGGRIWVESNPGQGATFRFTIPEGPRLTGTGGA